MVDLGGEPWRTGSFPSPNTKRTAVKNIKTRYNEILSLLWNHLLIYKERITTNIYTVRMSLPYVYHLINWPQWTVVISQASQLGYWQWSLLWCSGNQLPAVELGASWNSLVRNRTAVTFRPGPHCEYHEEYHYIQ